MKKNKLSLRNEIKVLNILVIFLTIEILIANSFFLFYIITIQNENVSPRIEFFRFPINYEEVNDTYGYYTRGSYSLFYNKMNVALSSNDLCYVVLHEYSHFMYNKLLTISDKKQWEDIECNITMLNEREMFDGYDEDERCEEWFANRNAIFMENNMYALNESSFDNTMEKYLYRITNKYIK